MGIESKERSIYEQQVRRILEEIAAKGRSFGASGSGESASNEVNEVINALENLYGYSGLSLFEYNISAILNTKCVGKVSVYGEFQEEVKPNAHYLGVVYSAGEDGSVIKEVSQVKGNPISTEFNEQDVTILNRVNDLMG